MSWFDRFIRVSTVILILAVIYLFFTMIQALDRLHFSNLKLSAALEKSKSYNHTVSPPGDQRSETETDIANAGYFARVFKKAYGKNPGTYR